MTNDNDFCTCKEIAGNYTELEEFGFWDMCCVCSKRIEDGFHYYNHYDGEDHIEYDGER